MTNASSCASASCGTSGARRWTRSEIALAFKRLRELPKAEGGTKGKRGGDRKSAAAKNQTAASRQSIRADDAAASALGIGKQEARDLETVFTTPGVPKALKDAVNRGTVATGNPKVHSVPKGKRRTRRHVFWSSLK